MLLRHQVFQSLKQLDIFNKLLYNLGDQLWGGNEAEINNNKKKFTQNTENLEPENKNFKKRYGITFCSFKYAQCRFVQLGCHNFGNQLFVFI